MDIRSPNEKQDREDLAAAFQWAARLGLHEAVANHFSLALTDDGAPFLVQPAGLHFSRVRASDLLKVDADDRVVGKQGAVDPTALAIHGVIHRKMAGPGPGPGPGRAACCIRTCHTRQR